MQFSFLTFFSSPQVVLRVRDGLLAGMFHDAGGVLVSREIELPRGIVEGGIIRDVARFYEALDELIGRDSKSRRARECEARLLVPDMYVFMHVFTLPRVSAKELSPLVYKCAGDFFPLPIAELLLDWSILPNNEKDTSIQVFVSAVRKDHFASAYEALRESNCALRIAENESISLARALLPDHLSVTAIIDIDTTATNLSIFDDASALPKLTLSIPIGDDAFTAALAERQKIEAGEATRMKLEEGFDFTKGEGWTIVVLQERVQAIIHEIEKAFAYYERQSGRSINRMILCGVGALIPQLDTYLGVNLKRSISVGDPFRDITTIPTIPKNSSPVLCSALFGLYRREAGSRSLGGRINFTPRFVPTRVPVVLMRSERFWRNCAFATFFFSMLLSGLLLYQTILAPKARYENERALRTQPLAPFALFPEEIVPISQVEENQLLVPIATSSEMGTSSEFIFSTLETEEDSATSTKTLEKSVVSE